MANFTLLALLIGALTLIVLPVGAVKPVCDDGNYEVTFLGVTYDVGANTSTWTYNVTCKGDPTISHFDFVFQPCDPNHTTILDAGPTPWEIITTKNKPYNGLRFDFGIPINQTVTIWFRLQGLWDENGMEVQIKGGSCQLPYFSGGPACFVIPEVPYGPIAAMIAAFAAVGLMARRRSTKT